MKSTIIFSFLLCISFFQCFSSTIKTEINEGWQFRQARGINWYPAEVPGVIHTDLMKNNLIRDPFFEMNERACQWVDKEDWEYKTVFDLSEEQFLKDSIRLEFKGLDTYVDVFLNNEKLFSANNMYREWKVECKKFLKKNGNTLKLYFHSPVKIDLPKFEASPYHYPAVNDQSENGGLFNKQVSVYARKAPYHYGWDWGPRLVTSGIWRPIYIEAWDVAKIEDLQIFQDNVSQKSATIRAIVTVNSTKDQTGKVSIIDSEGRKIYAETTSMLKKGINNINLTFGIPKPKLWWTNGLGEQYLYHFRTNLTISEKEIDNRVVTTGIRSIKLVLDNPDGKKTFHFELNGVPVFMKGANYIPSDNFLPRVSNGKYEKIILDAKNANMNMLRVWGGGIYENDIFYDLCDKYGILLWHDFMFACSMYPADKEMLENIEQEAIENVKRIRNHACLALWCGNNEIDEAWKGWGWKEDAEKLSKELAEKVWGEYKSIFQELLPGIIKKFDPATPYWESSPMVRNGSGDKHYWKVWQGTVPLTDYKKEVYSFMSEYGFQSFPDLHTIKKYSPDSSKWEIYSEVMLMHQRSNKGNQLINQFIDSSYRRPADFKSFLYLSQLLQADAMKMAQEAHRRKMPFCMGSLYWQIDDCWPVASWSSTDYFGNWKAQHYFTKKAYSEVLVSPVEENGKLNIYIISDRLKGGKANLLVELIDLEGKPIYKKQIEVKIPDNTSKIVYSEDINRLLSGKAKNELVVFTSLTENNREISDNTFLFTKAKEIDFPKVTFTRTLTPYDDGFELVLRSDKIAKAVYIELPDDCFLSDNFFDMVPGQNKIVRIITKRVDESELKQLIITSLVDSYKM